MSSNSPTKQKQPTSTQISFGLHSIQGSHFKDQAAVICVNGSVFVMYPRHIKPQLRIYESAYTMFIPPNEDISFSIGVVTPEDKSSGTGFLHCFVKHTIKAPQEPLIQNLKLESPGSLYTINISLYMAPSVRCEMSETGTTRAASRARAKTSLGKQKHNTNELYLRPITRNGLSRTTDAL